MKKLVLFLNSYSANLEKAIGLETMVSVLLLESGEQEQRFNYLGEFDFKSLLDKFNAEINEKNLKTYLVLPSEQSLNCVLNVPAKASRQIQKALPFLVEDHIASDPELCFIASGELQGNHLPCSVIDRKLLNSYVQFFENNRLNCERMISFCNLAFEQEASLHVFANGLILITTDGERFSFNQELLSIYLAKLVAKEEKKKTIENVHVSEEEVITSDELDSSEYQNSKLPVYLYQSEGQEEASTANDVLKQIESFSKTHDFPFQADLQQKDLESFYINQAHEVVKRGSDKRLINFLQGEFKAKQIKEGGFQLDANWKPAAYLLMVLVFISLLSIYLDGRRYEKGAEFANEQSKQLFLKIFPNTKNYTGMKKRVSALLGGDSGAGNQFLALMVGFSEGMSVINNKAPESLSATRFQYEQNGSLLKIDINASSFDTLNELKTLLDGKGFLLEIASTSTESSASTESDGVKGRLNLTLKN